MWGKASNLKDRKQRSGKKNWEKSDSFKPDSLPEKCEDDIVSMKQPEGFKKNPENKENLCKVKYLNQNKNLILKKSENIPEGKTKRERKKERKGK